MESKNFYDELRVKYQDEDRAKLLMQQLRTYQESKRQRKWWQKLDLRQNIKVKPKSWNE
ncbi:MULTISPECIES: hypothetical protein [unclassified Paenibacillus]|uniref:hypothetical protein n=1 Tax=unclassified Paenibacillus TaxID=185978 RepID=UPI0036367F6F